MTLSNAEHSLLQFADVERNFGFLKGRTMAGSEHSPYITDAERWQAVVGRDSSASGTFVYGVQTTGVYCRPGCASRLPRRENVLFFDRPEDAEQAGFRPCKRCQPRSAEEPMHRLAILRACEILETSETLPRLADLAQAAGLSPYHFHRTFRKTVGVTPRQYFAQKRLDRVRNQLKKDVPVTQAVYDAGFDSSSAFYATAKGALGMQPKTYQNGGLGTRIRYTIIESYLGWVLIAATDAGICAIEFGDTPEVLEARLPERFPHAELVSGDPGFRLWVERVLRFLDSPAAGLDLPLDIQGTAFQRRVWEALRAIPAGTTASYTEIAERLGKPSAVRAVAQACAANKIAVAIPCHRVVRADGNLAGYRWGIQRKKALLQKERR